MSGDIVAVILAISIKSVKQRFLLIVLGRSSVKVRVLAITNDVFFGGNETRLLALARTIDRNKFDYTLLTLKKRDEALDEMFGSMRQQYADAKIQLKDLEDRHPKRKTANLGLLGLVNTLANLPRNVWNVQRVIKELQIDVIDAHEIVGHFVGVLAGVLTGKPTVITVYEPKAPKKLLVRLSTRFLMALADAVVTDSEARRDEIKSLTIWPRPNVLVIPSGLFEPTSSFSVSEMRTSLGLPSNPEIKVIGQISRLVEHKGHVTLLKAARLVLEQQKNVVFLIVGFDTNARPIRTATPNCSRRPRNQRACENLELPWLYRRRLEGYRHTCSCFSYDSLPNAIIEGMSLGKPAVVTSVGDIPKLVQHNTSGSVVFPEDSVGMADAILRLIREPDTASRFGSTARQLYEKYYCPEIMTRRLEGLFDHLSAVSRPVSERS